MKNSERSNTRLTSDAMRLHSLSSQFRNSRKDSDDKKDLHVAMKDEDDEIIISLNLPEMFWDNRPRKKIQGA